jgi:hypothetical protein
VARQYKRRTYHKKTKKAMELKHPSAYAEKRAAYTPPEEPYSTDTRNSILVNSGTMPYLLTELSPS